VPGEGGGGLGGDGGGLGGDGIGGGDTGMACTTLTRSGTSSGELARPSACFHDT
jgi:hypothetical protein